MIALWPLAPLVPVWVSLLVRRARRRRDPSIAFREALDALGRVSRER